MNELPEAIENVLGQIRAEVNSFDKVSRKSVKKKSGSPKKRPLTAKDKPAAD